MGSRITSGRERERDVKQRGLTDNLKCNRRRETVKRRRRVQTLREAYLQIYPQIKPNQIEKFKTKSMKLFKLSII